MCCLWILPPAHHGLSAEMSPTATAIERTQKLHIRCATFFCFFFFFLFSFLSSSSSSSKYCCVSFFSVNMSLVCHSGHRSSYGCLYYHDNIVKCLCWRLIFRSTNSREKKSNWKKVHIIQYLLNILSGCIAGGIQDCVCLDSVLRMYDQKCCWLVCFSFFLCILSFGEGNKMYQFTLIMGAGAKQMCAQFILHQSDAYLFIAF